MSSFCVQFRSDEEGFAQELLSCPVVALMAQTLVQAGGGSIFYDGALETRWREALDIRNGGDLPEDGAMLLVERPAPLVSAETVHNLLALAEEEGRAELQWEGETVMRAFKAGASRDPEQGGSRLPLPEREGPVIKDARTRLTAQRGLMRQTNEGLLQENVLIHEPELAQISPFAHIGAGSEVLPNCQIYGLCRIGQDCVIGPNSLLKDVELGDGVKVNASQVHESTIGDRTTVGPFAYVRPGCEVGSQVKIGDFVELKKVKVGNGTKMSHLTYLGDCELGENINVGCGVVMVNYDGKNKHRSYIGKGAFIGCNVNLISPVRVGEGAFVAAGSTITEDVPPNGLAVARVRQTNKEGWAERRRAKGEL